MTDYLLTVNDKDVTRSLDKLIDLLGPIGSQAFLSSTIGPHLARRAKERFRSEGDAAVGGAWAPLKPATIRIRSEQGFGPGPINRRTGELENWVVQGGWDAYPTALGASMRFPRSQPSGELRKKVQTAQGGKKSPSTVARPVLAVDENDLLFLQASLAAAVEVAIQ